MKAAHTTVRNMTQNVESTGHKVLWTNLFLALDDLRDQKNKCMQDSAIQTKGHSPDFRLKKLH